MLSIKTLSSQLLQCINSPFNIIAPPSVNPSSGFFSVFSCLGDTLTAGLKDKAGCSLAFLLLSSKSSDNNQSNELVSKALIQNYISLPQMSPVQKLYELISGCTLAYIYLTVVMNVVDTEVLPCCIFWVTKYVLIHLKIVPDKHTIFCRLGNPWKALRNCWFRLKYYRLKPSLLYFHMLLSVLYSICTVSLSSHRV